MVIACNLSLVFTMGKIKIFLYIFSALILAWRISDSVALEKYQTHMELLQDDTQSIPPLLLRMIEQIPSVPVAKGIIANLDKLHSKEEATFIFCATALQQNGEGYVALIQILHEELIVWSSIETGISSGRHPYFLERSEKLDNRRRRLFVLCLEHGALNAPPETLYRLFQIERWALLPPHPPNTYSWLIAAAESGFLQAQYVLAKTIWDLLIRPESSPIAIRDYVNTDAYFRFLHLAAEGGHRPAQENLAYVYLGYTWGQSWKNKNHINVKESLHWLNMLAEQSDDLHMRYKAISMLGRLYLNGTVVPKNHTDALYPFQRIPEDILQNNHTEVQKNHLEALLWFQRIPHEKLSKYCGASFSLAQIYRTGQGVEIDLEKSNEYQKIYTNNCVKP